MVAIMVAMKRYELGVTHRARPAYCMEGTLPSSSSSASCTQRKSGRTIIARHINGEDDNMAEEAEEGGHGLMHHRAIMAVMEASTDVPVPFAGAWIVMISSKVNMELLPERGERERERV